MTATFRFESVWIASNYKSVSARSLGIKPEQRGEITARRTVGCLKVARTSLARESGQDARAPIKRSQPYSQAFLTFATDSNSFPAKAGSSSRSRRHQTVWQLKLILGAFLRRLSSK